MFLASNLLLENLVEIFFTDLSSAYNSAFLLHIMIFREFFLGGVELALSANFEAKRDGNGAIKPKTHSDTSLAIIILRALNPTDFSYLGQLKLL